jgi:hypothetical protein
MYNSVHDPIILLEQIVDLFQLKACSSLVPFRYGSLTELTFGLREEEVYDG